MVAMVSLSVHWRTVFKFTLSVFALFLYNEYIMYYIVLLQCAWPNLSVEKADFSITESSNEPLKAMFLADTHLLGSREGHWFDKLRREWQMERSFQSAALIFSPDIVFVLGDLFDEGKWSSDGEFYESVAHFHKMFQHSDNTKLYVVAGNHDIGFHYMIDENKRRRFTSAFESPSVKLLRVKDNTIVMLNSMAFEGDDCSMCHSAETSLKNIARQLDCAQGIIADKTLCQGQENVKYTRPIVVQHFPMYRISDRNCSGPDSVPAEDSAKKFKPRWDCLSKDATEMILGSLKPRFVVSGHTHHFCHVYLDGTPEWTIPSFNWRNKKNPSFLLAVISNNNYEINKCYLPSEVTVMYTYIVGGICILLWLILPRRLMALTSYRNIKRNL